MALRESFLVLLVFMCMSFHGGVECQTESVDTDSASFYTDQHWGDSTYQAYRTRLASTLLRDYDMRVQPEPPVNVTFSMEIQRIERLDETTNSLYLTALTMIVWLDNRLVWDPANFDEVSDFTAQPGRLWTPKIIPTAQVLEDETVLIGVRSNGEISQHRLLRLAVPCTSDMTSYPFNSPSCQFKVADWGYGSSDINLTTSGITSGAAFNGKDLNALWEIKSFNAIVEVIKFVCCPGEYEHIKYKIELSRKPNGFAVRVLAPAVLTSMLILFCFLIPPSCGERPVVCSVLLVATIIQLASFNLSVPMVGEGTPFLGVFFCFSVFLAFFAVVVSVVSLNMACGFGIDTKDGEMRTAGSSKTAMLRIARFIDVACFIVFTFIFAIAGGVILNNYPK